MLPSRRTRRTSSHVTRRRLVLAAVAVVGAVALAVGAIAAVTDSGSSSAETPITVYAAGDLGHDAPELAPVANLIKADPNLGRALLLGDICYPDGDPSCYPAALDPTYGPIRSKVIAVPGNHDYHTAGGSGFFGYYPDTIPRATDVGNGWVVITVNTEVPHGAGSAQEQAVKARIAEHPGAHFIAITHHPRFTACSSHSDDSELAAIVADLDAVKADLFLAGHNHCYERFKPQPGTGVSFFTAGTGGNGLYSCKTDARHAYCDGTHHGALRLKLYSDHYEWAFVTTNGQTLDAGSAPTRQGGSTSTTSGPGSTTSSSTSASTSSTSSTSTSSTSTTTLPAGCRPPTTVVTGSQSRWTDPMPGSVNATRASWVGTTPYPVVIRGGAGACWTGGIVWGTWPEQTTPWTTYHNDRGITAKGDDAGLTISRTIVVNHGDGYGFEAGTDHWSLDHVRVTHGHDDAIENDWTQGGRVTDSLLEAAGSVYSADPATDGSQGGDGRARTVWIDRTLLRVQGTPTSFKGGPGATGGWFKLDPSKAPHMVLTGNTLRADRVPSWDNLNPPPGVTCSGNTILWAADGVFPAKAAWRAACPDTQIVEGEPAIVLWTQAFNAWANR